MRIPPGTTWRLIPNRISNWHKRIGGQGAETSNSNIQTPEKLQISNSKLHSVGPLSSALFPSEGGRGANGERWVNLMSVLFPTSVVGSLPRPAFVLDLINDRPPLARAEYEQRMQAAIRYAVAMQEQ